MTSSRPAVLVRCLLLVLTTWMVACGDDNGVTNEPPTLMETLLYMETPTGGKGRVTALNLDGTGRHTLTSGDNAWAPGDVTPDGRTIVFFGPTGPGTDQEILTMNYAGLQIEPVTDDPWQDGYASFLPDGRIIYASSHGSQFDIYRIDADGSNVTQLTTDLGSEGDPSLSPDGTKIVFSRAIKDIWVMNADGTGATNLTNFGTGERGGSPRFSPDGLKIVFLYALNSDGDLMIMDANGANRTNLTSADPLFYYGSACFSLDGQHIYATAAPAANGVRDIYRLDANGANRIPITDTAADEAFLSVVNLLR
jgi:Tol biopolymer transport system component